MTTTFGASDDSAPLSGFPKTGVRLSYVVDVFIEKCGGREILEGLTTGEVLKRFIKVHTAKLQLSYCDLLKQQGHTAYGETTEVFISHAHSGKFLDLVSALKWHLRDKPETVLWFDLFSINQHSPMDWSYDWLSTTFRSSIQQLGYTIMILSPWNNPVPYTRAWCIFEVYCTAQAGNKFEIALSENDRRQFLEEIGMLQEQSIDNMLATIQAENCECYSEEERKKIFKVIQDEVGFAEINSMVFKQYRDWVIKVAKEALENTEGMEQLLLLDVVGRLYLGQGKYNEAMPFLTDCLEKSKSLLGENHPKTLLSINNLSTLYYRQGRYRQAQPLFEDCLKKRKFTLGENHRDTIESMSNLACLYDAQGLYEQARPLLEDCFDKRRSTVGEDHPFTLAAMSLLAILYSNLGQHERAWSLLEDCLEKSKSALGEDHPVTLTEINNLAALYFKRGKYEQARPLFEDCFEKTKSKLGENHPTTLEVMNNLAMTILNQGLYYEQAWSLLEDCFERSKSALGENHPFTLTVMTNLKHATVPLYWGCLLAMRTIRARIDRQTSGVG